MHASDNQAISNKIQVELQWGSKDISADNDGSVVRGGDDPIESVQKEELLWMLLVFTFFFSLLFYYT